MSRQSLRDEEPGERKRSQPDGSVEPSPPSSGRFDGPTSSEDAPDHVDDPPHEPTGLGLARSIAASVSGQARRRKRRPMRSVVDPQSSGARPDGRDPQLLSDAVERLVESKGWSTEISVHTLLARWGLLVGSTNAEHSRPESYSDSVLTIRTDSTAWATQFRMMAPRLVAMLNEHLGDGTVTRVKVLGPDAPSWKKGRLSVRDGRGPRDTYG